MSLLTGNQFVQDGDTKIWNVTGVPSGYIYHSIVLPDGWTVNTMGSLSGGNQAFTLNTGIGSGTIIIEYSQHGFPNAIVYLDVYSGATRMGEEIKQDGIIFVPPVIHTPPIFCDVCDSAFPLSVFADPSNPTNFNNNDKTGFYLVGNAGISAITMTLQQYISSAWQDIET